MLNEEKMCMAEITMPDRITLFLQNAFLNDFMATVVHDSG